MQHIVFASGETKVAMFKERAEGFYASVADAQKAGSTVQFDPEVDVTGGWPDAPTSPSLQTAALTADYDAVGSANDIAYWLQPVEDAIWCYAAAGALLALAAAVYLSKFGKIAPATGLGPSSYFMNAFLPMFIGAIFAKYSSHPIAIFMGGIVQACLDSGLARMNVSTSLTTVINGLIVCAFLIYSSNVYQIAQAEMFRQKMARADRSRDGQASA